MNKEIYLDNASLTKIHPKVLEGTISLLKKLSGNPSSTHKKGREAKSYLDKAREIVANALNCEAKDIIFTSSGSESINLAIFGVTENHKKGHIISSSIEHSATLRSLKKLEEKGFEVTYLKPDKEGLINPQNLDSAIKDSTVLVTLHHANNEIGTIQKIKDISQITKSHNIPFHLDACQSPSYLNVDVKELSVDLMTLNSTKIHGPSGVGLLFANQPIKPLILGGSQEHGLRAGTENIALIYGFAIALELAISERKTRTQKTQKIKTLFVKLLKDSEIPHQVNTPLENSTSSILNIRFLDQKSEVLLPSLDMHGIYASAGSACNSGSIKPSKVLLEIGLTEKQASESIRFSFSSENTEDDIKKTVEIIKHITSS